MHRNNETIELVFPESEIRSFDNKPVKRGPGGKLIQRFAVGVNEMASWFSQYEIERIEVSISGGMETGGVLKLAVSAKGEGGLKITLKPKSPNNQ